ncbi:GNAT family N-acetyltransferase [Floricoccus penangensis]|uniref:GNAT family N-acetyltransferase n=1 Tax=Floricoccus penangensis TaxID=1859475 RepID=UPI00203A3CEA|nr:GNAT family N-acetyltransferase [Floricoccus penangensis]URZ87125.1 GNAT family N-acetyltransferase [Floricoccus penangensis]
MDIKDVKEFTEKHYELLLNADPDRDLVDSYLKRSKSCELVTDNKMIGLIVLLPTRPETIEIVNISVSDSEQGMGYGKKLLEYAIKYSKDEGYKTIEIGTGTTSFGQLYLYQKVGFRLSYIDKDFFIRHYNEEIEKNGLILKDMVRLSMDI